MKDSETETAAKWNALPRKSDVLSAYERCAEIAGDYGEHVIAAAIRAEAKRKMEGGE